MTIAREEIFGPVLVDPRLRHGRRRRSQIANDTPYGLAAYVSGGDLGSHAQGGVAACAPARSTSTARPTDLMAPFGGYKKSGNGREWGDYAFAEFLEVKAVLGYTPKAS